MPATGRAELSWQQKRGAGHAKASAIILTVYSVRQQKAGGTCKASTHTQAFFHGAQGCQAASCQLILPAFSSPCQFCYPVTSPSSCALEARSGIGLIVKNNEHVVSYFLLQIIFTNIISFFFLSFFPCCLCKQVSLLTFSSLKFEHGAVDFNLLFFPWAELAEHLRSTELLTCRLRACLPHAQNRPRLFWNVLPRLIKCGLIYWDWNLVHLS